MSRRGDKNGDIKLRGQFIPAFLETRRTPAWKALSMGARELYMTLKVSSLRRLQKQQRPHLSLGAEGDGGDGRAQPRSRSGAGTASLSIYGFIVMTNPGSLGVGGKGKAPQWRLTELETPLADSKEPTLDYKKWDGTPFNGNQIWRGRGQKPKKQNPGRETTSRVDAKQRPVLDAKQRPPHPRSGRETTSISAAHPGRETSPYLG